MSALFTELYQVQLGSDLVADGTAETTTTVEDMSGFDEITYIVKFGDVDAAAVITLALKENTASSTSSPTPTTVALTSTSAGVITNGAVVLTESSGSLDDKIVVITAKHQALSERYVFLSITATVESYEVDTIIALKGLPRTLPVTQPSDVVAYASAAK